MADYFGKYRGRSGPAIEPGTLAMMGSIGEEYAKGIRDLASGIGQYFVKKDEYDKIEKENEIIFNILNPEKGTKYSEEKHEQYSSKRKEVTKSAHDRAVSARDEYEKARVDAEEGDYLQYLNRLDAEIAAFEMEVGRTNEKGEFVPGRLDREIEKADVIERGPKTPLSDDKWFGKAGKFYEGLFPIPPTIEEFEKDPAGSIGKLTNPLDYLGRAKDQVDKTYAHLRNKFYGDSEPKLLVNESGRLRTQRAEVNAHVDYLRRLREMELDNPGSTMGMPTVDYDSKSGKILFSKTGDKKIIDERLDFYEKFKGMPDAGRGDINLHQLIPQYYGESKKPEEISSLINFGAYPKNRLAQEKLEQYRLAEKQYYGVLNAPEKTEKDFMVPLTQEEKFDNALDAIKGNQVREGFGEKLASLLDKVKGPKMTVLTHPETGEKIVAIANNYHTVKSGQSPADARASKKFETDAAEAARTAKEKVEDDRDIALERYRKRRAELEDKETLGELTPTEAKELEKMKSGETERAIELKFAQRTGRVIGNFPNYFQGQQSTLEIE